MTSHRLRLKARERRTERRLWRAGRLTWVPAWLYDEAAATGAIRIEPPGPTTVTGVRFITTRVPRGVGAGARPRR